MKKIAFIIFILFTLFPGFSQNWQWATKFGSTSYETFKDGVTDKNGNSYIVGTFQTLLVIGTTTLNPIGSSDIFIVKYNNSGNVIWAKSCGSSGVDNTSSITLDSLNNIYFSVNVGSNASFGTITGVSAGAGVAKIDMNGNFIYAKTYVSASSVEITDICFNKSSGAIWACGYTNEVGCGITGTHSMGFLGLLINPSSSFQIVNKFGHSSYDSYALSIAAIDQNNVVLCGYFDGIFNLKKTGACTTTYSFTSASSNGSNGFVANYNYLTSNWTWAKQMVNSNPSVNDKLSDIFIDNFGVIHVAGLFEKNITFAGYNFSSGNIYSAVTDIALNSFGNVWYPSYIGSTSTASAQVSLENPRVYVDSIQNVYLTAGYYKNASSTIDFGNKSLSTNSSSNTNFLLSKFNWLNNCWEWVIGMPLVTTGGSTGKPLSISALNNGDIYLQGSIIGTCAFNPTLSLTSTGQYDIFNAKLNAQQYFSPHISVSGSTAACIPSTSSTTLSIAQSYPTEWYFENNLISSASSSTYIATNPGNYQVHYFPGNNCSYIANASVYIANLTPTISIKDTSNSQTYNQPANYLCSSNTITLTANGANTYTWTGSVINGVAFTPISTNTYIVIGSNNTCTNSAQITVSVVTTPTVSIASTETLICAGGNSVTLTASGANNYSWANGVLSNTPIEVNSTQTFTVIGFNNSCISSAQITVSVTTCTDIKNNVVNSFIRISPNPFTDEIKLDIGNNEMDYSLTIVDVLGKNYISIEKN